MSKARVTSIAEQSRIFRLAQQKISPPAYAGLTKQEMSFFQSITDAKLEWAEHEIRLAVILCRTLSAIETVQSKLDEQGYVLDGLLNPLHKVLCDLCGRSMSLCRALNIHAAATQGRARDQAPKNVAFRQALSAVDMLDDSDLLMRPK